MANLVFLPKFTLTYWREHCPRDSTWKGHQTAQRSGWLWGSSHHPPQLSIHGDEG